MQVAPVGEESLEVESDGAEDVSVKEVVHVTFKLPESTKDVEVCIVCLVSSSRYLHICHSCSPLGKTQKNPQTPKMRRQTPTTNPSTRTKSTRKPSNISTNQPRTNSKSRLSNSKRLRQRTKPELPNLKKNWQSKSRSQQKKQN